MFDKVLICQNCHSPFVYSEFEQSRAAKEEKKDPVYCPICTSIKSQEATRPKKPK